MKLLLCAVNTKYIHSNPAVHLLNVYAGQHLPEAKDFIEVMEYTINNRPSEVCSAIYEKQPDAVFFSCYIWNRTFMEDLLDDLHIVLPDAHLWLGGPEVSFDAEKVLAERPFLRGVMIGEGEETFLELSKHYICRNKELQEISGICFRDRQGRIVTTQKRPLLSMDDIPFIYRDETMDPFANKIVYYESSRGCPFSCSYCLSSVDKTLRLRSLDKVFEELRFFLDHRVPQVKFVDRTFNVDHFRTGAILKYLSENDNGVTNFHFEVAGELLDEEDLLIMQQMRPGLIQLEIGVQTTNPAALKAIHRQADPDRLRRVVSRIRQMGNIHLHLDLIAGLPFEDYDSFAKSFNDVYSMKPTQLQLGFLKVLKGSPMESQAAGFDIRYSSRPPYEVLSTRWLRYAQLIKLKETEEMVEMYYNSGQFTRTIRVLETEFDHPFSMYRQLAAFYRKEGYFLNHPARIYRYQVLLDFILQHAPGRKELYRELLVFDLYLRENLKSRPDFAPPQDVWKESLKRLHPDREVHAEVFRYPVDEEDPQTVLKAAEISSAAQAADPYVLLFDYRHRDPLTHNAAVRRISFTQ